MNGTFFTETLDFQGGRRYYRIAASTGSTLSEYSSSEDSGDVQVTAVSDFNDARIVYDLASAEAVDIVILIQDTPSIYQREVLVPISLIPDGTKVGVRRTFGDLEATVNPVRSNGVRTENLGIQSGRQRFRLWRGLDSGTFGSSVIIFRSHNFNPNCAEPVTYYSNFRTVE